MSRSYPEYELVVSRDLSEENVLASVVSRISCPSMCRSYPVYFILPIPVANGVRSQFLPPYLCPVFVNVSVVSRCFVFYERRSHPVFARPRRSHPVFLPMLFGGLEIFSENCLE